MTITACVVAAWMSCHISITKALALERFEFRQPHLGTIVDLTLYAPDEAVANDSAQAAFQRIKELNKILSDYLPDSEAMRLCQTAGTGQAVQISPELYEVLEKSLEIANLSDGAFDVTLGPVIQLWRSARKQGKLPSRELLEAARERVGWQNIVLNPQERTAELRIKGMMLDFGGIAKGYIADHARAILQKRGIRRCLVSVAGDISAGDPPPDRVGWRIGIAPLDKPDGEPSRFLQLQNCSVSTAGDAFQFIEIDGVRYSHIVDPGTGLGLTRRSSVTVVAPQGVLADGLDTAVCILGPERGLQLIERFKGAEALIVIATENGQKTIESSGLSKYLQAPGDAQ